MVTVGGRLKVKSVPARYRFGTGPPATRCASRRALQWNVHARSAAKSAPTAGALVESATSLWKSMLI